MKIVAQTVTAAVAFVRASHRHSRAPRGGLFAAGVAISAELRGVAIGGRPVSPGFDSSTCIEVTRCCTLGDKNACSALYGAICGAAKRLGYSWAITYTRADETGSSLRASGFTCFAFIPAREWSRPKRGRPPGYMVTDRFRWERKL